MDLRFYLSLLLRRLHYVLLFLILGTGAGVALAMVLPPIYRAVATLVVESEQIPDNLAASTVQTGANEALQIIQQRILTRETLVDMANRLGIYDPAEGEPAAPLDADAVVQDLRSRISITTNAGAAPRNGPVGATIVTVSFEASTSQRAASVANELVTLILRENVEMRTRVAGQTLDFFVQEVQRLDEEMARQSGAILAFQEANKDALPESLTFRRSRLETSQERLRVLERDGAALQERRDRLVELFETTGRVGPAPAEAARTAEERQLADLRSQLSAALAVLAPTNPRVRLLQTQIASLEAVVAQQATGRPADSQVTEVTLFEMQLADLDAQIASIEDEKARLTAEMDEIRATIDATPGNAIALDTLQRDFAALRSQYDQAVQNRARAETGEMIESLSKGQRISVIEQATPPRAPRSPNRPLIAAAGVGGGLFLGLAVAALLELLNRSVRRPIEITEKLGIAPFAALPLLMSRQEIRRRRLRMAGAFAAVMVGVPVALWVVHSQVMPLDLLVDRVVRQFTLLSPGDAPGTAPGALPTRFA